MMIRCVGVVCSLLMVLPNLMGMDIVRDGKAETAIVIPDDALPTVKLAARELQYHVKKSSGADLPIYSESDKPVSGEGLIYVGNTKAATTAGLPDGEALSSNSFIIKLDGNNLYLLGNDLRPGEDRRKGTAAFSKVALIGSLSAVYEFLEQEVGVRWLWPGKLGEYVPEHKHITVEQWDRVYKPRLVESWWGLNPLRYGERYWDSHQAFEQVDQQTRLWCRRQRFCIAKNISGNHAYSRYWKRFGKTHPEFFALLPNGKREPIPGDKTGHYITMCVSNPGLIQQTIKDWVAHKEPPWSWQWPNGYNYLPCGDNDAPGMCLCNNCRAMDYDDPRFKTSPYWQGQKMPGFNLAGRGIYPAGERQREPSLSDRYAKFYMAVYEQAVKINPDVLVTGSAYVNYADPPKETKLNEHICIAIVPPGIFPQTEKTGEAFRKQWQGWRDTGAVLKLRPNITHAGHNMPVSYTKWLHRNIQYAAENGMIATSWDSLTGQFAAQGPTLYLLARMHVRPKMSRDAILDEYYTAFGRAKEAVKAYFDYWEHVSSQVSEAEFARYQKEEGGGDHRNWLRVADRIFTPDVMRRGRSLMQAVLDVKGLSETEKARVAFIDAGLTHAELTLKALTAYKRFVVTQSGDDKIAAAEAMRRLVDFRKRKEETGISNMGYLYYREPRSWDPSLVQYYPDDTPLDTVWKFRFDPNQKGQKEGWQRADYDDSSWANISVTSCWEKQAPGKEWKKQHGRDYDGVAWYRTSFELKPEDVGKENIKLNFGAVDEACTIYLNGKIVQVLTDKDIKWDAPFSVDISDTVKREGANILVVRVTDRVGAGGVWRPVRLNAQTP